MESGRLARSLLQSGNQRCAATGGNPLRKSGGIPRKIPQADHNWNVRLVSFHGFAERAGMRNNEWRQRGNADDIGIVALELIDEFGRSSRRDA